ncbi:Vps54-like protein-domain-containing protein [Gymnopilus junonius]|uniref:Vps54-like protein-domain-containing protein n=1 Tax=Gymnopilus junonius TaxID=109634 RepID=A0A9P5TTV4_GYMJU|nr:Vps54-like protein-domain-containing protein [Gymnopilus junonius]
MSDVSSVPSRVASPVNPPPPDQLPIARPYRFTWDPASRRPGPESVSGTTEGRGGDDFGAVPHPFTFLNPSTTSLALGSIPSEWSSSRTGFHAISTVLNSPHKSQAPPKPHSYLPPVPPVELPRVRRKDFESYLKVITPEWERFEHHLQLDQDVQAQIEDDQWTPRNSTADEEPSTPTRKALLSVNGKNIPPLDSVPPVFFQREFNLGDPRTFATVTEQDPATSLTASLDDSFADPLSLSHSLPLLEKFSHYADIVEQHLVREISIRSTSFFAALTNLQDLQTESERCLDRVGKLRSQLQDVDNKGAKRGLEMVRKESKMANLSKVREGVKMISGVVEMTGVAKSLVNAGQWGEALGVVEELEKLWDTNTPQVVPDSAALDHRILQNGNGVAHGASSTSLPPTPEEEGDGGPSTRKEHQAKKSSKNPPPVSLSSLQAFSALPSHLRTLTMEIAASLSNEFVSVLRNDLEMRIDSDGKPNADADQALKDRLKPLLLNLVRTKGLKEGILSWREVVLIQILPAFNTEEDDSSEISLFNGVEGLQAQGTIIVGVLTALGSQLRQKVTDIPALEEDLEDIVSSSAELSNTQAAKVISFRAEQHAALELAEFLTFFNDSWAFVIRCETLSRRMIVGLRGTVVGQAKLFLQSFHQSRISRSAKLVEDELWNPTEITPGLQHITNILVDSAVRDPPELIIKTDDAVFSPLAGSFPSTGPDTATSMVVPESAANITPALILSFPTSMRSTNGPPASSTKHLRIEERTYYTVSATAEVLTLLLDYLRVVVNLSMLTTDTMSRVIEFLKSFNSRTCQVVLGAGAMRSAGLKNITAKHLALASQSLSIIFELIPYVRETFRRHLSQKQSVMLVEFDKLKRDYQEHQNEIHSKLIAIMGDRLNAHIKSLKVNLCSSRLRVQAGAVDWSVPKPGGGVNDYMEILVKETVTLHKVLSRYLAPPVVEYVMTQVFAAINHRLSEEYAALVLPDQEAKTRLLGDAKYLHSKLTALKNVGAPTGMLETVVAEKPIARPNLGGTNPNSSPQPSANPHPPTRSNTLSANANQRLKGLLSGRGSSFNLDKDKALPIPARTPSPPPVPPISDKPSLPSQNSQSKLNNGIYSASVSQDRLTSGSNLSLSMGVSPIPEAGGVQGFKQVELPSEDLGG